MLDIEQEGTRAEAECGVALTAATVMCGACSREIAANEAQAAGWGYWSVGFGRLHPFCPECAAREFGRIA